uniref:Matrix metalloproteinase-9 n=1 Tax=Callorhinchus milii TaxID=7868 RepID=V9KAV1_CALMI
MMLVGAVFSIALLAHSSFCAPKHSIVIEFPGEKSVSDLELAKEYLNKFGYINLKNNENAIVSLKGAILKMQHSLGIPESGQLDSKTINAMKKPRCGVPDVRSYKTFDDEKWDHTDLTYYIVNHTPDMVPSVVDDAFARAFKVWSDVTPLTFKRIYSNDADILIQFGRTWHGDPYPFDGNDGLLAHAYPPGKDLYGDLHGDAHFDDDEFWTLGKGAVVKTQFGNANGDSCHFPFIYEGKTYKACTTDGRDDNSLWCATTADFDKDKKYGFCPDGRLFTIDGNSEDKPCVFPFVFDGKTYESCTSEGRSDGYRWCATTSNFDIDKKYGFCPNAGNAVVGGNADGEQCKFPFTFYGKTYSECTTDGRADKKLWCSTTSDFNKEKKWGFCPNIGYSLFLVAAHEFGHSLGLDHSTLREALMYPMYKYVDFPLHRDDIEGIQYLYGPNPGSPALPTIGTPEITTARPSITTTTEATGSDICSVDTFDAIAEIKGQLHFFKNGKVWKVASNKQLVTGPEPVTKLWPKAPSKIDSAFQDKRTQKVYIFSGESYYIFSGKTLEQGYPKNIYKLGIGDDVKHIVGAIMKAKYKVLLFGGTKVWRLNLKTQTIEKSFTNYIDYYFAGVPIDANNIFTHKGYYNFVHNGVFWKMNHNRQIEFVGYVNRDLLKCKE